MKVVANYLNKNQIKFPELQIQRFVDEEVYGLTKIKYG